MTIEIAHIRMWKTRRRGLSQVIPRHVTDPPDNCNPNRDLMRLICRWLDTDQTLVTIGRPVRVIEKTHIIMRNTSTRTPGIPPQPSQVRPIGQRRQILVLEGRF